MMSTNKQNNASLSMVAQAEALASMAANAPSSDDSSVHVNAKLTGVTLNRVGKWLGAFIIGSGAVGSAATTIQLVAKLQEQTIAIRAELDSLKAKADQTAEDTAYIRGMIESRWAPTPPKPRRK
jgi:hypothetical protein